MPSRTKSVLRVQEAVERTYCIYVTSKLLKQRFAAILQTTVNKNFVDVYVRPHQSYALNISVNGYPQCFDTFQEQLREWY